MVYYEVKPEGAGGPLQIVHCSMLRSSVFVARYHEVEREVVAELAPIIAEEG